MALAPRRALPEGLAERLVAALPGRVEPGAALASFTTYRLGGPAEVLVRLGSEAEVAALAAALDGASVPVLVIGRGSNLLVADAGVAGLVLVLDGELDEVTVFDTEVRAGGAVALPVLARRAAAAGRTGLEFYVGIPGTVGGAVRMNAGGHGRETREVLRRVRVADLGAGGGVREVAVEDLALGYRTSGLGALDVVLQADFAVAPDDPAACEARLAEIVRWRREHQPGGANAGSVFRNPEGDAAGRLVEACGLKGLRVGGAVVSEKHANFIQAEDGATAADVRDLVAEVQRRVEDATGVRLQPELHFVGFEEVDA